MTPAGINEVLTGSQSQVLRDVHCGGRAMDEDSCFHALRELAEFDGEARHDVQSVERKPRKQRAVERRSWARGRGDHVAAKCPSGPDAVGRYQDEMNHERYHERRVCMTVLFMEFEMGVLEQRSWRIAQCLLKWIV